jgi:hypothetical protein
MGGIEVVDPRYRALYERAVEVLDDDPRVISVALGGSIAAGTADRWSDLDLTVVTEPDAHDAFVADWPEWLARIVPTVFARTPSAPFIVNAITDEGLTVDIAIWPGAAPEWPTPPVVYTAGMLGGLRFDNVGDALEHAVAEQLRGLAGPLITFLQREEHLALLAGIPHLIGLLTTVFLAETGEVPPGKRWNATYTEEQRAAVAALPPAGATRDSQLAFSLGLARLLVERARPLYPRYGLEWPAALALVAADRLQTQLGVDARWLTEAERPGSGR